MPTTNTYRQPMSAGHQLLREAQHGGKLPRDIEDLKRKTPFKNQSARHEVSFKSLHSVRKHSPNPAGRKWGQRKSRMQSQSLIRPAPMSHRSTKHQARNTAKEHSYRIRPLRLNAHTLIGLCLDGTCSGLKTLAKIFKVF